MYAVRVLVGVGGGVAPLGEWQPSLGELPAGAAGRRER